jgi:hypothetical protein
MQTDTMQRQVLTISENITVMVKNITDIYTTSNNISPQIMIHRIDHTTYTEWNTGPGYIFDHHGYIVVSPGNIVAMLFKREKRQRFIVKGG